MRGRARLGWTLVAALASSGCLGGAPSPPTHRYLLQVPPVPSPDSQGGLHIGVERLAVDPPYDDERLVYRASPDTTEVGFYNYHRWASPLDRLLASALAAGLAGTPGVASAEPVAGGDYQARLAGRLIYLEEVDHHDRIEARIALALALRSAHGELLWKGTALGSAVGPASDGGDVMGLVEMAFGQVVAAVRKELAAALAASASGG